MKNQLTILLFCYCIGQVWGQNFTPLTLDTTLYGQATVSFDGYIPIQNNTSAALNMRFEEVELSIPNGWQTSHCLGSNCLAIGVKNSNFTLAVSSPFNYINTHFYPGGTAGIGYVKIKVYEVSNPSDTAILTYHGVAGQVSSIYQLQEEDVAVFPNPFADNISLLLPNDEGKKIPVQVCDALGRIVYATIVTTSTNSLNISHLEKGVYIVCIGHIRKKVLKQ